MHRLGDAVAGDVPGDRRVAEFEFAREFGAAPDDFGAFAERGQRAGRAAELSEQDTRPELRQPLGVAIERRQPDRRLVAEGYRQCVLQMGASCHWRVAIAAREVGQVAPRCRKIGIKQVKPVADLKHHGGVHDVLSCRAPMQPAP